MDGAAEETTAWLETRRLGRDRLQDSLPLGDAQQL